MRCSICKYGQTQAALVTITLQRQEAIVLLKQVPADVCDSCGENYLSEMVTDQVLEHAGAVMNTDAEVVILCYAA